MKKIIEGVLISILIFFGACLFLFSNHIGKWRAFVVLSPSMEPAITTGSVVITQYSHPKEVILHGLKPMVSFPIQAPLDLVPASAETEYTF